MTSTPASFGLRFAAIAIDWLASSLIVTGLTGKNYGYEGERTLIFFVEVVLLTALTGASAGQRVFRLQVLDNQTGGAVAPLRIFLRTLLILLVVPALFRKEGVAYHDVLCRTQVVRKS